MFSLNSLSHRLFFLASAAATTLLLSSTPFARSQATPTTPPPAAPPASSSVAAPTPAAALVGLNSLHSNTPQPFSALPMANETNYVFRQPSDLEQVNELTQQGEGGPHEGIKVHGHWIIDVKNPDGTLAEHRDFQNSLTSPNVMVALLYGAEVPSDFLVSFSGTTSPCSPATVCGIVHNLSTLPANAVCSGSFYCVTGLTVTPTFGGSPSLVFAGQLTATSAGNINQVSTDMGICGSPSSTPSSVSPATCASGGSPYGYTGLTGTSISTLTVISGQIIQVTVTITFS